MNILEIKNLKKNYGKVVALDGIDLSISKGEIYGFIGPNGAGKTTTIRLILGLLKANFGEIKIFGKDAWNEAVDIHKKLVYVPGEVNLWPNLTGGEVIDLFLSLNGKVNYKKKDELIKKFDFDPTKKCRTYSKGNRQKIALISAFASDADLYILDEPTSGLDPLMEKVFQECIMEVKKLGKTVFLSSHILSEVEKLCDKISIIRNGKIIESGSLKELRHLMRLNIFVETKEKINDIDKIDGVYDVVKKDGGISFQIDSDKLSSLIKSIAKYNVVRFESYPPTLEELFMSHYKDGGK
jgi:ABC-2 type transport system ATP-binding protein